MSSLSWEGVREMPGNTLMAHDLLRKLGFSYGATLSRHLLGPGWASWTQLEKKGGEGVCGVSAWRSSRGQKEATELH